MNGLFILRQIDPSPDLSRALETLEHITYLDDGTVWVDDRKARDAELNTEISGGNDQFGNVVSEGCTIGWGIFDSDMNLHGKYRALDRAEAAISKAKVTVMADVDIEPDPVWTSMDKKPKE